MTASAEYSPTGNALDLNGYRRPACYVMALLAIQQAPLDAKSVTLRLDSILAAQWLAARLANQGHVALTTSAGGVALVEICLDPKRAR